MEGRVNYTVVGIFVISLCVVLFAAIFWMGSMNHGKKYNGYIVYMHEDVMGLSNDSPVRFNGVKVGYVESIHLVPNNSKLVRLILMIEPDVKITSDVFAVLIPQGVTGVVTVNLKATTETGTPLVAPPGEQYPVIPSHPSLLNQVSAVLPSLASNFQKVTQSITEALSDQNIEALQQSLANIKKITQTLADNSESFSETMKNVNKASANISKASEQLPESMADFNETMKSAKVLIRNFSTQVAPGMQSAMTNLSMATKNVNDFTEELERNPSMLLRGKRPDPLGPGEK